MRRALFISVVGALCLNAIVNGQQGGINTSVLPARSNLAPPGPPTTSEYLTTDVVAQKQVEGSIAASTRNWNHLFAVFNDSRAVNAVDFLTGETSAAAEAWVGGS